MDFKARRTRDEERIRIEMLDDEGSDGILAVIGGGSWGTTLAALLAGNFDKVNLCEKDEEVCRDIVENHENSKYLDDFKIPANIVPTTSAETALEGASIVLVATPSYASREVASGISGIVAENQPIVIATKGLEGNTGLLNVEVWREELAAAGHGRIDPLVLSGPTLAREICSGLPSVCVLAGRDTDVVGTVKSRFTNPLLSITEWSDPLGVQAAAALKNVYAVACGLASGMYWGDNVVGSIIWRGMEESSRFIGALGGDPAVMSTPAGIGDLVATCISPKSRNHHLGRMIAGKDLDDESVRGVTEGAHTAQEAARRCRSLGIKLELLDSIWLLLSGKSQPRDVLNAVFSPVITSHVLEDGCIVDRPEAATNKWSIPDMGV
ncbi:MAG: NAD(P)H-dependent glycerol-3-phosphate dehydrogenase, partial [Actinobacteria bacterium]|nr:NAD(P)H-dependent glycerol-3-phosphate dehydrogenase [Actinomycetota bacterium]